jgi:sugar phosphate permease
MSADNEKIETKYREVHKMFADSQRSPWVVVAASTIALVVGGMPFLVLTFSVFSKAITQEMGWSRAEASSAISIMLYVTAVAAPILGTIVDRFGVTRPLIASIILSALALVAISMTRTLPAFLFAFAILGLVSGGLQPLPYSKVVVSWFDRSRGIALGIVNAGQGVGATILPAVAALLLANFGWRGGYIGLAIILLVVALPGALFIVRENPLGRQGVAAGFREPERDVGFGEMVRVKQFWIIVLSAFALSLVVNGTLPNLVPLLTDRGMPLSGAVATLSLVGISGIVGRLGAGLLVDILFAPFIALVVFLVAASGLGAIWLNSPNVPVVVGVVLLGLSLGAEVDLMGYLTSRYFPKRAFAKVYGFVFLSLIMGQATGVYLMSMTYDVWKSYEPVLAVFAILIALVGLISLLFGPYRFPPESRSDAQPSEIDLERQPLPR